MRRRTYLLRALFLFAVWGRYWDDTLSFELMADAFDRMAETVDSFIAAPAPPAPPSPLLQEPEVVTRTIFDEVWLWHTVEYD